MKVLKVKVWAVIDEGIVIGLDLLVVVGVIDRTTLCRRGRTL